MKRRSEQGVALVITLILLSVITFMAVTFLVLAQRGREQTSALTDKTIAKEANEQAVQMGLGQILSRMLAATNGFFLEPLVSTNYVSFAYDTRGGGLTAVTNVNYTYPNGARLTAKDLVFMLNNQLILPRAPVFVVTNKAFPNNPEFRFYLDLNRNFKFEDTGFTPDLDNAGNTFPSGTNAVTLSQKLGDPQWIGILDHPDQRHSPSNRYIARVAYFIQPIGNSLDFNFIHNQAKQPGTNVDGYFRNQGIASWEINFAGFLNALNLNQWTYKYDPYTFASMGTAFSDAVAILRYRYAGSYNNLKSFRTIYGNNAAIAFSRDGVDGYTIGPLQTTLLPVPLNPTGFDNDLNYVASRPWSGSDNSNYFYTVEEMFNFANYNVANGISNSFALAGQRTNSYDAYTFYRMLSQIGVGSVPDSTGKMNLNYVNVGGTNTTTNFIPWTSTQFFTNAANKLFSAHADFAGENLATGNIQVYPTNQNHYSPAVNRMLQMAANMYDASTNKITAAPDDFDYPSVFRPVFGVRGGTNIFIVDYVEVTNGLNIPTPYSLQDDVTPLIAAINAGGASNVVNIYGIPWVVGVRKGFPNFNKFSMQNTIQLSRKLQITRPSASAALSSWHTNIQYTIGVSNILGAEAWNSYRAAYPRAVRFRVFQRTAMTVTNEFGILTNNVFANSNNILLAANSWPGFPNSQSTNGNMASFQVPLSLNYAALPASVYHAPLGLFDVRTLSSTFFEPTWNTGYPQPKFGVNFTNRLQFVMVDETSGRVIDYVHFDQMDSQRNVVLELAGTEPYGPSGVWDTNRVGYLTNPGANSNTLARINGVEMQIEVSQNYQTNGSWKSGYNVDVTENDWSTVTLPGGFSSREDAIRKFQEFMNRNGGNTDLSIQVPYTPTRTISVYSTWQANDPLVHYTLTDLTGLGLFSTLPVTNYDRAVVNQLLNTLRRVNDRYLPWNGVGNPKGTVDEYKPYLSNPTIKDPLITNSDAWYFPSNKYATIGDLGRIHRGTPWQTIYFKSDQVDRDFWQNWTGDNLIRNKIDDSDATRPTNDWEMLDMFTTAVNDNASRGTLSINQTNLAAWAAIFDGVIALSNAPSAGVYVPIVIGPDFLTGAFPAITNLVAGINGKRNDYSHNVFTRLGDILATRELSVASPFLDTNSTVNPPNDAAYEWLPKQILSLLRVGSPRYVIYAYSQSLKPANNGYFTGGGGISSIYTGTVTNYQVTSEVVTRTVVRIEANGGLDPRNPFTPLNPTRNPIMPDVGFRKLTPPAPNPRAVVESFTILPPE
jgi:hypothetical protein